MQRACELARTLRGPTVSFRDLHHPDGAGVAGCIRRSGTVIQITFGPAARALVFRTAFGTLLGRLAMKRLCFLAVLMVLSSSAHAGNSFSFVVGGHRIRIEAPRHCNSPSCVSVSIPGIYQARRGRDRFDEDDRDVTDPVKAPVAVPPPIQTVPPPGNPPAAVAAAAPPAVFKSAAATTQEVAAPPLAIAPQNVLPPVPPPPPAEAVRPPAVVVPQVSRVSHQVEDQPADTPVGDWQSEGSKGAVRIERCGKALCGYALKSSSNDKGEAVLVNMKPKTGSQWTGNVYSHDSGDTYYGTMALKGPNALRVEACALGRFYCSGNNWSRIVARPEKLITSRQFSQAPRS